MDRGPTGKRRHPACIGGAIINNAAMRTAVYDRVFLLAAAWSIIAFAVGCASTSRVTDPYAFRLFSTTDFATALAHADAALANLGYAVRLRDPDRGLIETMPFSGASGDSHQPRIGSARRDALRTIATVRVTPSGTGSRVACQVVVQQRSTQAHRLFRADRSRSDLPSETPIELEGATTRDQNTVWRTLRRDRSRERAILAEVQRLSTER